MNWSANDRQVKHPQRVAFMRDSNHSFLFVNRHAHMIRLKVILKISIACRIITLVIISEVKKNWSSLLTRSENKIMLYHMVINIMFCEDDKLEDLPYFWTEVMARSFSVQNCKGFSRIISLFFILKFLPSFSLVFIFDVIWSWGQTPINLS